jgi:RAB protein geranylgeranyltransferase component A
MSLEGRRVLHIDRNPYYGDSGASLNITSLWKQFRPDQPVPPELGANRDWNIDQVTLPDSQTDHVVRKAGQNDHQDQGL